MPSTRLAGKGPILLAVLVGAAGCDGALSDPVPAAPVAPTLHLLVAGEARVPGMGPKTACSHGEPAAADGHRWCAFYRSINGDRTRLELWVIDVTRVMAGESVPCDGTSAGCLLMTDHLYPRFKYESYSHPDGHRFESDTLLFLGPDHPGGEALNRFEGYVWAWRPGWKRPRVLTSDRGVLCRASQTAATAICVDGVTDQPLQFDLRAGRIVDRDDSLLPIVERMAPLHEGTMAWSAAFSPSGDILGYSSWRDGEPAEALRVLATDELGTKASRVAVNDGRDWRLSPDAKAVYFKRAVDPEGRTGTLWSADFPSGANQRELFPGVHDFEPVGATGVAFRTNLDGLEGVLRLILDRRQPDSVLAMTQDAHAWYPLEDNRFMYILQSDEAGERGFIGDARTGATCALESRARVTAYGANYLPSLDLVTWTEPTSETRESHMTFVGRPGDCGPKRPLGIGLTMLQSIGSSGLVFARKIDPDGRALSFHYAARLDDRPLEESAVLVLNKVDADNVGYAGTGPEALIVGTTEAVETGRGLYVFGPLPKLPR